MEIRFLIINHRNKRVLQTLLIDRNENEKTLINLELKKDELGNWYIDDASIKPEEQFGKTKIPKKWKYKSKLFILNMPD